MFQKGAKIKHTFNLIERDVCWHENVQSRPQFHEVVNEVRRLFPSL